MKRILDQGSGNQGPRVDSLTSNLCCMCVCVKQWQISNF